jgi:predicted kinase
MTLEPEQQGVRTLIILRGLPGAGKSTLAKVLGGEYAPAITCEADQYFYDTKGNYNFRQEDLGKAHQWCKDKVRHLMIYKAPLVIISNTSTRKDEFQHYIQMASQYDYQVHSVIVENRHGKHSTHNVPTPVVANMRKRFEVSL